MRNTPYRPVNCLLLLFVLWVSPLGAQENDECYLCHDDPGLTYERNGVIRSGHVDPETYLLSVHGEFSCVDCHIDLIGTEMGHDVPLEPVMCELCHDQVADEYMQSIHGEVVAAGEPLGPQCWDCHGAHDIRRPTDPLARTNKFNIPVMCGTCHKEGTPVTQKYDLPVDSVLLHYSQSIHGFGLFEQGLIVSAVCTDCHTAHDIRPLTDPQSTIHRQNIATMCQTCHARIEQVHEQVIDGRLWSEQPDKVPACNDCHRPHEVSIQTVDSTIADANCLSCHSRPDLTGTRGGQVVSMYVDTAEAYHSVHQETACASCHTGTTLNHPERACATVIDQVDCSICHAEAVADHSASIHGQLIAQHDLDAPTCTKCHGTHATKSHLDPTSPTFATAIPSLCGRCHGADGVATQRYAEGDRNVVDEYLHGTHGIGLSSSGLVVTATCTDCHTTHRELPASDSASSVHPNNIPETCASCHHGINEAFSRSVHSPTVTTTDSTLPICSDCHQSHRIDETRLAGVRLDIMTQCGDCHAEVTELYFETAHGKFTQLGATAAMCYDCHGAHDIMPLTEPSSRLAIGNIVGTCQECHAGANANFAGFIAHAPHDDKEQEPLLYYVFWFMTGLLIFTFTIAGSHTLLWLPRTIQGLLQRRPQPVEVRPVLVYERFKPLHRRLHAMIVVSFIALALTGMTLKFSDMTWAQVLSTWMGGPVISAYVHRIAAIITFLYFAIHIWDLVRTKTRLRKSWWEFLTDKDSMIPNRKDLSDLVGTLKWFVGLGEKPSYGRFTYWEKFDYFAVFWGVAIIGSSGLILWFPEFFTQFMPGWMINVATIIHSDEALLAVGFIFTIHFFNTHFRPDKFPIDTVMFSGQQTIEELRHERPEEFKELIRTRQIRRKLVKPIPRYLEATGRWLGLGALVLGIVLVVLIFYSVIFHH